MPATHNRQYDSFRIRTFLKDARLFVPGALSLVAIAVSLNNYLLFHTAIELFASIVAITAFTIAWNSGELFKRTHIEYLGTGYLWIGVIDLLHALAYRGMGVFDVQERDVSSELWIAGRAIEACVLVSFPFLAARQVNKWWSFAGAGLVSVVLLAAIATGVFPATFIEGQGLTSFKIASEWAIIVVLIGALMVVRHHSFSIDISLARLMQAAIVLTIAAEFCFTQYSSVFGGMNMVGHIFKLFSFWLIYVALVDFSLRRPFQAIARQADTFGAIPDPVVVVGRDGRIQQANSAASGAFPGLDDTALGADAHTLCHPREVLKEECPICRRVKDGTTCVVPQVQYRDEAAWRDVALAPVSASTSDPAALVCTFHDVTERTLAIAELESTVRRLRLLSSCNEILTQSNTKPLLLQRVCDLFVQEAGYAAAWAGLVDARAPDDLRVDRVAHAFAPSLPSTRPLFPDTVGRRDPGLVGRALAGGEPVYVNDPAPEGDSASPREKVRPDYRAGVALPLMGDDGVVLGVFAACSMEAGEIAREERQLLKEIAGDLGFGLAALRQRRERREAEQAREREADRVLELEQIVGRSPAIAFLWKAEEGWPIEFVSNNVELFGYSADDLMTRRVPYTQLVHEDDLPRVEDEISDHVHAAADSFKQEYRIIGGDGETYWVDDRTWVRHDADGNVTHFEGIVMDITARREAEAQLDYLARYDSLTGLANRREFEERIRGAKGRAQGTSGVFAVHYLDLDHFKDVNDTLGHPMGDLLLQQVAIRLQELVRTTDVVARFGGDEFAVLQTDLAEPEDSVRVAEKMQEAMVTPFQLDGHEIRITCSIGVVVHSGSGPDATGLLAQADIALYRAKAAGRNAFRFYDPKMDEEVRARVAVTTALRAAVKDEEFLLLYQPEIDLDEDRIVCTEALLRWRHPEHGLLTPDRFIGNAEDSGLIYEISEWVLSAALNQLRKRQSGALSGARMAINISPLQLRDESSVRRLIDLIERFEGDKRLIELELTERSLMHMTSYGERALNNLAEAGISISIDDFGTGYSSLSYISRYPVSRLKIAQTFVMNIPADPTNADIVKAVVNLARSLNLSCIAEGVETLEQFRFLKDIGCREYQGYYFSPAIGAAELEVFAAEHGSFREHASHS